MDEKTGASVVKVKLDPAIVPGASPDRDWLLATVMVQFDGPHQGLVVNGVQIPDTGDEAANKKAAIAEAQRLARLFAEERNLANPSE